MHSDQIKPRYYLFFYINKHSQIYGKTKLNAIHQITFLIFDCKLISKIIFFIQYRFKLLQKRDFNHNISKNNISFYVCFGNENLQILEFYFCENILLKFHHKLFLCTNSAIDEAKSTSTPRIWKEICVQLFANCITKSEI